MSNATSDLVVLGYIISNSLGANELIKSQKKAFVEAIKDYGEEDENGNKPTVTEDYSISEDDGDDIPDEIDINLPDNDTTQITDPYIGDMTDGTYIGFEDDEGNIYYAHIYITPYKHTATGSQYIDYYVNKIGYTVYKNGEVYINQPQRWDYFTRTTTTSGTFYSSLSTTKIYITSDNDIHIDKHLIAPGNDRIITDYYYSGLGIPSTARKISVSNISPF